jgi:hypothetical protein
LLAAKPNPAHIALADLEAMPFAGAHHPEHRQPPPEGWLTIRARIARSPARGYLHPLLH